MPLDITYLPFLRKMRQYTDPLSSPFNAKCNLLEECNYISVPAYQIKRQLFVFVLTALQLFSIALYLITNTSMPTAFAAQLAPNSPSGTLGLLRAGVSVVRLLVTYEDFTAYGNYMRTVSCTGLGVIVASWPAHNASDQNNWILTDSSLVNGQVDLCAGDAYRATLTSIRVYLSTAYNQQEITFQGSVGSVICQDQDCRGGATLFALDQNAQGQLLPFIDLAQQQSPSNKDMAVELTTNAGSNSTAQPSLPTPSTAASNSVDTSTFPVQAETFRTPSEVSPTHTLEAGTPLINTNGQLTGLHMQNPSSDTILSFIEKKIPGFPSRLPSNPVHDGWQQGMNAYSKGKAAFPTAYKEFQIAASANHSFQAAKNLAASIKKSGESQLNPASAITLPGGVSIGLWELVIGIVALFAVVLLVIALVPYPWLRVGFLKREFQAQFSVTESGTLRGRYNIITLLLRRSQARLQQVLREGWKEIVQRAMTKVRQILERAVEQTRTKKAKQLLNSQPVPQAQQSPLSTLLFPPSGSNHPSYPASVPPTSVTSNPERAKPIKPNTLLNKNRPRKESLSKQETRENVGNESSQLADLDYLDFELEIGLGNGRRYPVTVIRSTAGEAREIMHFPFDEITLENQLLLLQTALLRSGGKHRRIPSPEEQTVQRFGQTLFDALFIGEVRSRYAVSQREAISHGKGLRLKLRIQSSALAALPWEFLYDPGQAEYVCLSRYTPIVRYIELPHSAQPLTVTPPIRILGMIASPQNLPSLDTGHEQQRIERAIEQLQTNGSATLTWLQGQTWQDLLRALRLGTWHIFHFIGHGKFDSNADEGFIALADDKGQAHYLSATQLGRLLIDHRSLRLVVLNSCEGALGGKSDIFSSTAAILVQRGIPAVLAMQYEITDRAAIELSHAFYEAITDGLPVDAAVGEARKAISIGITNTVEWGTPVLYMRCPNGVLFHIKDHDI